LTQLNNKIIFHNFSSALSAKYTLFRKEFLQWKFRKTPSHQLSDTASQLVEVMVEVNVTAVDWLATFSNYGVMTKL